MVLSPNTGSQGYTDRSSLPMDKLTVLGDMDENRLIPKRKSRFQPIRRGPKPLEELIARASPESLIAQPDPVPTPRNVGETTIYGDPSSIAPKSDPVSTQRFVGEKTVTGSPIPFEAYTGPMTAKPEMTGVEALELLNEVEARRMAQRQGSDIGGVPFGPMAVETGSLGSPISKDSPTFIEALRGQPVYDDQGNIVSREGGPAMFLEYLESKGAINPKDVREQNIEKFLTTGLVGDIRRATEDPNEGLSEREIAAREDYKKSQETDFVKLAQDQLAQDDQEAVSVVKAAEQTAKTGDTSKEDLESVIASMFGRSYKPTDEGALALINLGAGIAKGDLGAGLAGAGKAIVGERDRRRKDMLAAAQAKYYATAGERSNKLSYQDVLETARKEYKGLKLNARQSLFKQIYGRDPAGDDLAKAEGELIRILADRVAAREASSAYAGGDPLATSRANPNIVPPESLYRFGRSLGLNVE